MILAATTLKQGNPISRMARRGFPELHMWHISPPPDPLDIDDKLNINIEFRAGSSDYPESQLFAGKATKKGRGNTTWTFSDKKPFNITLTNDSFAKLNFPLFGWPADSEFSLLADAQDKTHTRTPLGHAMAVAFGHEWAPRTQKVRVYIDDDYRGFYTIVEKLTDKPYRENIDKVGATDISGSALTGDYMWERLADYQVQDDELPYKWTDDYGNTYLGKIPDPDKYKPEQIAYGQATMNAFMDAVMTEQFGPNGWRSLANAESISQARWVADLFKTGDGWWSNLYWVKYMNSVLELRNYWDFGGTMGNGLYTSYRGEPADSILLTEPTGEWISLIVPWMAVLNTDPYFQNVHKKVFEQALPKVKRLLRDLHAYEADPRFLQEVADDRERWPAILSDANYIVRGAYENEQAFRDNFLTDRLNWWEGQMNLI